MGEALPPYYGESKFYEKKRAETLKKISELEEVVKVCDEKIAECQAKIKNREVL